jgi:hypothetical protein
MTTRAAPPAGAITYQQWLLTRIERPGTIYGPDVIDDCRWWQHIPGLNPHAGLEARTREAERAFGRQAHAQAEAEAD